ncbi:DUF3891 family protein [Halobacillus sp. Marseille-Q1614]|uniref:DUF3891 family protein n=1 Tax=Halobacillus sp. Marseille-Q1614 TaxID=2709134 RepID=UPI00156F37DF|nr:DUF3891 family protein [Halobacillus sp. Marseille-Q1614]
MIVNEQENHFLMIAQHDHALVSGEIVLHWRNKFLLRSKLREEADWAISQHDRAWIPLDQSPLWNDEKQRPYSFVDYPVEEKLKAYQQGIQEVADRSYYAGILCSNHYQSFFSKDSDDPLVLRFLKEEEERCRKLAKKMKMEVPPDIYQLHFDRLQFCDDISLYVCMQEPGIDKEDEIKWFKNGFRQKFDGAPNGIMPKWPDPMHVTLDPFPFEHPFNVRIPYRLVNKEDIKNKGLTDAYQEADVHEREVRFIPE